MKCFLYGATVGLKSRYQETGIEEETGFNKYLRSTHELSVLITVAGANTGR